MYHLGLTENPYINLHRRLRYCKNQRLAVHPSNNDQESLEEYLDLFQQLKGDHEKFFQCTRMQIRIFTIILETIAPYLEKKLRLLRNQSHLRKN